MRSLTGLCCMLLVALSLGLCLFQARGAAAANFTVSSLADTPDALLSDGACADAAGACTLRAALQQANTDPSADIIGFGVTGTINLAGALPALSTDVTINGPGANSLTVRRDTGGDYRIFTVTKGVTAAINGLTVTNGLSPAGHGTIATGDGGGVLNFGTLSMTGCSVSSNSTATPTTNDAAPHGGGIANRGGTMTLTNCVINNNSTGNGGGSPHHGGHGGGIFNAGGLTMTNCEVYANRTGRGQMSADSGGHGGYGGGILSYSTLRMYGCGVNNNATGDGADAQPGSVNPAGDGGSGGGIFVGGSMTAVNCLISGNTTGNGGKGADLNCGQGDGGDGGGIANPVGMMTVMMKLSQSTVVNNRTGLLGPPCGRDGQGGGIYGGVRMRSSIIAFNYSRFSDGAREVFGQNFDSRGYNYIGVPGGNCCFTTTDRFGSSSDQTNVGLGPDFVPRGGLSLDGALALDVDDQPVLTDKRGAPRPVDNTSFPIAGQPGGDQSDIGAFETQLNELPTPTPTTVQFGASSYSVAEGCVQAEVTVTRAGPKDVTTVAAYSVIEFGPASQRGDFTQTTGIVSFAPGEETKTIPVLISEDAYAEGTESFPIFLGGVQGGQLGTQYFTRVYITDDDAADGAANPIDDAAVFVGQHYHDFFSRQADPGGLAFWMEQLAACDGDPGCLDRKRVDVSAAFFLSIEFQQTGYFAIRVNKIAFGNQPGNPRYTSFLQHAQELGRGVVVGQPDWEETLEANKRRHVEAFVARNDFREAHDGQNPEQYVDSLFASAGVTPTQAERDEALSHLVLDDTAGRARALRSVVESASVYNRLYNPAFVLMQYFAYLRRDPDDAPDNDFNGYYHWLYKLDQFTAPGEDARDEGVALARVRRAEMVRAFLRADEFRRRFGQ